MTASTTPSTTAATAPLPAELTPPAGDFVLQAPAAVPVVPLESASGKVRLTPEDTEQLDMQVAQFLQELAAHDVNAPEFKQAGERILSMGNKEIEAAAAVSSRMLERPTRTLSNGLFDKGSEIGQSLIDLRRTVEDLDPSRQGDLFQPRKLLGLLPFGNRLAGYFDKYQSSQTHLNAIIDALKRGKDELMRDNAAIEQEKANLWNLMQRLEKLIYIGKRLDAALDAKSIELEAADPEKARVVREELLFNARQKLTDLLQQTAVNVQGYLALDLVRKSNLELIKGVDRATTTTVSALRTAVIVAQALNNQKLVLDQISALNTTTGNLIVGTSEMLREQSNAIHQQAASSTIDLSRLQQAFGNIYQTMDALADFKLKALASMQTTVDALGKEVDKARTYLDRSRDASAQAALQAPSSEVRL